VSEAAGPAATCARCGEPLAPAAAYLSELGSVCGRCFNLLQNERDAAVAARARDERSFLRRASSLAAAHAIWPVAAILVAQWAHLPAWLSSLQIVAGLVLVWGLRGLFRSAFLTALALDAAGVAACEVWAATSATSGGSPLVGVLAVFPLALFWLTWWLRRAFSREADPDGLRGKPSLAAQGLVPGLVVAAVGGIFLRGAFHPRVDPAKHFVQDLLPRWETQRAQLGSEPGDEAARQLAEAGRAWPGVAEATLALDRAWPDDVGVRASVKTLDAALAAAKLPYLIDVWPTGRGPVLLTHALEGGASWRVGAKTFEVRRLRRLDHLNVVLGLYGVTADGVPAVMLDRVEAGLAVELPLMFGRHTRADAAPIGAFDRVVLARTGAWLVTRLGPSISEAALALDDRRQWLEEMRLRLNGGALEIDAPDGFVLGDEWLAQFEPLAEPMRSGGPLVLEQDLKRVVAGDRDLRTGPRAQALAAAADLLARSTEAHEIRHAADGPEPLGTIPPRLFELMDSASAPALNRAALELRAFLGELHDGPFPACLTLGRFMREVYGANAGETAHHYATRVLLAELDPEGVARAAQAEDDEDEDAPGERLATLCELPDADLRGRAAATWKRLYAGDLPPAERLTR
jgi:hypothetical protein